MSEPAVTRGGRNGRYGGATWSPGPAFKARRSLRGVGISLRSGRLLSGGKPAAQIAKKWSIACSAVGLVSFPAADLLGSSWCEGDFSTATRTRLRNPAKPTALTTAGATPRGALVGLIDNSELLCESRQALMLRRPTAAFRSCVAYRVEKDLENQGHPQF